MISDAGKRRKSERKEGRREERRRKTMFPLHTRRTHSEAHSKAGSMARQSADQAAAAATAAAATSTRRCQIVNHLLNAYVCLPDCMSRRIYV